MSWNNPGTYNSVPVINTFSADSPIPELVIKVKDLYYSRKMSDVRFLIPVLNGLDKVNEVTHPNVSLVSESV